MNIYYSSQFKKDFKRVKKQNKNLDKLKTVIDLIVNGMPLNKSYRDHQLSGNWKGHRNCHIEPDWILIYRVESDSLYLERIDSHSVLFK